jgi:hypothetical protein
VILPIPARAVLRRCPALNKKKIYQIDEHFEALSEHLLLLQWGSVGEHGSEIVLVLCGSSGGGGKKGIVYC